MSHRSSKADRAPETYSLSDLRQNPHDHIERIAQGEIETITDAGREAMVVMSPETYDAMALSLDRGHMWDQAISRIESGDEGQDARQAIREVAAELGLDL
ncbi:MAG: type II toxin-antitoxin system prevent-host-death family antitoxin [Acidobacteriota bacterium]